MPDETINKIIRRHPERYIRDTDDREIRRVVFPDGTWLIAGHGENVGIILQNTFHGDHDEIWIIEIDKNNIIIAKHNPRYVESIYFMP